MKRAAIILVGLGLSGCLFWRFPLFHLEAIDATQATGQNVAFNAKEFAQTFWSDRLPTSFDQAVDAATVVGAARKSPQTAREYYGRNVGLSRRYYYYLRGTGTIVSIGPKSIGLTLGDDAASSDTVKPDVLLATGMLFGNAVRDATGLLIPGEYPNSQHFNDISTELNRIVETSVIPLLKDVAVGQRIRFVGCAEVASEARDLEPLTVVPIHVEFE